MLGLSSHILGRFMSVPAVFGLKRSQRKLKLGVSVLTFILQTKTRYKSAKLQYPVSQTGLWRLLCLEWVKMVLKDYSKVKSTLCHLLSSVASWIFLRHTSAMMKLAQIATVDITAEASMRLTNTILKKQILKIWARFINLSKQIGEHHKSTLNLYPL